MVPEGLHLAEGAVDARLHLQKREEGEGVEGKKTQAMKPTGGQKMVCISLSGQLVRISLNSQ